MITVIPHHDLAEAAYENAVRHGFHTGSSSYVTYLSLILSEVYEALDAHRKDRRSSLSVNFYLHNDFTDDKQFADWYRQICSSTFEDELADVVIRLYDLSAHCGLSLDAHIYPYDHTFSNCTAMGLDEYAEFAYAFTENVVRIMSADSSLGIPLAINTVYEYAYRCNIDLYHHVLMKMRYNTLRPYRHGVRY